MRIKRFNDIKEEQDYLNELYKELGFNLEDFTDLFIPATDNDAKLFMRVSGEINDSTMPILDYRSYGIDKNKIKLNNTLYDLNSYTNKEVHVVLSHKDDKLIDEEYKYLKNDLKLFDIYDYRTVWLDGRDGYIYMLSFKIKKK